MMNETVLLIGRDRDLLEFLSKLFQCDGWSVLAACDRSSVLQILQRSSIDLVVEDLRSLGNDGFDILHLIREHSNVAALVVSARRDKASIRMVIEKGADAYLLFPIKATELRARAHTLIRQRDRVRASAIPRRQASIKSASPLNNVAASLRALLRNFAVRIRAFIWEKRF